MEKRILHILGSMNIGGAETFIMNLYRNIDRTQLQFDFLLSTEKNAYAEEIRKLGGCIYIIEPRRNGLTKYKNALNNFFSEHKYAIVHQHCSSLSPIDPLVIAKKWGVPTRVIHSHNSYQSGMVHKILHYLRKPLIKKIATHYLGCSDLANNWMYKYTGVLDKAIMINNGVNTSLFSYNENIRKDVRDKLGVEGKVLFGHVGRFSKVKNHRFIIKIFNAYLEKYGNAHLILVGNGELYEETRSIVTGLNIDEHVTFLGVRTDVNELLQAMDILLMPSFYEGLPVSLVEAQVSGVMTYATNIISKDVALADNIKFLSLSNDENFWAEYIYNDYKEYIRKDKSELIKKLGFDILTTNDYLVNNIYLYNE